MNFTEWEQTAESKQTLDVSRDIIRDIYPTPMGIDLTHDVCLPRNPFAKPWETAVVCWCLPVEAKADVEKAGGTLNTEDYYDPEGWGTAVFNGEDSLKKAYEFSQTIDTSKAIRPKG